MVDCRMSLRGDPMNAVSEGGESMDMDTEEDASQTTEPKVWNLRTRISRFHQIFNEDDDTKLNFLFR